MYRVYLPLRQLRGHIMKRTNIDNIVFFANIRPLFDHLSILSPIEYSRTNLLPITWANRTFLLAELLTIFDRSSTDLRPNYLTNLTYLSYHCIKNSGFGFYEVGIWVPWNWDIWDAGTPLHTPTIVDTFCPVLRCPHIPKVLLYCLKGALDYLQTITRDAL